MIGEYVIINHFDRPCARLIAEVTKVEGEYVEGRYITTGARMKVCRGLLSDVVPVSDFGIQLQFYNGRVTALEVEESHAAYPDGKPRRWQPEHEETHGLRLKRD